MHVTVDRERLQSDLERLVAIPSIAFAGYPREPLDEAAALVEELLREAGAAEIQRVDVPGEAPTLLADFPGDGPTVLLYAHYDVQPAPADGLGDRPVHADASRTAACTGAAPPTTSRASSPTWPRCARSTAAARAREGARRGLGGERAPGAAADRRRPARAAARRRDGDRRQRQLEGGGADAVADPARPRQAHGHAAHAHRRPAQRPLRRRRAGRAARAHAPDRHAAPRRRQRRRRRACRTATGTAPSGRRTTSAARPACSTACELVGTGDIADRVWARHAISVLGLDAPAVEGAGQHRDPARPGQDRRARPAGRRPGGVDGGRRASRPRERAVGRAGRDRGRAGVDADRTAGARSRRDARSSRPSASRWPRWAAAARSRSWPSCTAPTRTRRSCSGALRTQTSPASTPPTSPSISRDRADRGRRGAAAARARLGALISPAGRRSPPSGREATRRRRLEHGLGVASVLMRFPLPRRANRPRSACGLPGPVERSVAGLEIDRDLDRVPAREAQDAVVGGDRAVGAGAQVAFGAAQRE